MYDLMVRIIDGKFDVQAEHRNRGYAPPEIRLEKGIVKLVEVDSCSHAASYLRPVCCCCTAFVDVSDIVETALKIKQSYREELEALLEKVDRLDKDIIAAVKAARPSRR